MAFRFELDESVAVGVRRMARAQTTAAVADLADPGARGLAETVFDVRKRCKKARAIVRLVREPLGPKRYRKANVAYRDTGRELAGHRDAEAVAATFEGLVAGVPPPLADVDIATVRAALAGRAQAARSTLAESEPSLRRAEARLTEVLERIERWRLPGEGWALLGDGVELSYARGASAMTKAAIKPTPERLHELRKHVKYTRAHLRTLRSTAPSIVVPMLARFEAVGDQLGEARDLALLEQVMGTEAGAVGGEDVARAVGCAAADRRAALEASALGLARWLYAEPAPAFSARLGRYWDLWRTVGPEPASPPSNRYTTQISGG